MSGSTCLVRGREAFERRAWADAHEFLAQADHAEQLEGEDLERLANAAFLIGREEEFERALERAHRWYLDAGDSRRAARCAFWIGFRLFLRGESGPANGWLARGQHLLEEDGRESAEEGYLLLPVADRHLAAGEWEPALALAREAAAIGARVADRDLPAVARHVEGRVLLRMGRIEEGLALLDEAMVAVTSGELSPLMTGLVYCSVIASCQEIHALGRAREWTSALARWCEDQPQMLAFHATCLVHRAEVLQLHGAWDDALADARRARERYAEGVERRPPATAFYQEGEVLRLRGDLEGAEECYRSASAAGVEPQPGLALLLLARGRARDAAAAIRSALDATTDPLERARLLPAAVEIHIGASDPADARAACGELEAIAAGFDSGVLRAAAAQARGTLDLAEGNPREALAPLRAAWKEWQSLEVPYAAARTRELVGLACRAVDDGAGCRMELDAAAAAYEALGAAPDLARVEALRRSPLRAHDLTRRELEVLRLVAAGNSNKGIAGELSLSVKTVERHISNIFAKLDVPSRAAATAWAYEHDLVRAPQ